MNDSPAKPPVAAKMRHSTTHHGITIHDDYAWLRDHGYPEVTDPAVLGHLNAENAWFESRMAGQQGRIDTLFTEMRARIKEADTSVPQKDGEYLYWIEFEQGAEYKKWWRRPVTGGADQLILDEGELAAGKEYFRLEAMSISAAGRLLAYSFDDTGSERFTARIKDLDNGALLADEITGTLGSLVWVAGDRALVYTPANEQWRTDKVCLHWLGEPNAQDAVLYREHDEGFRASAGLSANEEWLILSAGDHETSEIRLLPAADPLAEPLLVRARQTGLEYDVDLREETLFIHTNDTRSGKTHRCLRSGWSRWQDRPAARWRGESFRGYRWCG